MDCITHCKHQTTLLAVQVKLVLQRNQLFVESPDKQVLQKLLKDSDIKAAHEASGGRGILQGRGRRDTAAQAMASHLQNIDLTEAVPDDDLADAGGDGDAEAAEAEREMHAASAKAQPAGGPAAAGPAAAGGSAAAAADAAAVGAAKAATAAKCENRPVPFAEASAIGAVSEHDVDIFSFEISALHVRLLCAACVRAPLLPACGGSRTAAPGVGSHRVCSSHSFSPALLAGNMLHIRVCDWKRSHAAALHAAASHAPLHTLGPATHQPPKHNHNHRAAARATALGRCLNAALRCSQRR